MTALGPRYEIRAATRADHASLLELARYLDSVNLPHDPDVVAQILDLSERSFSGEITSPKRREYVFVLRECASRRVVGTSMIIGQLGRREAPYIYFDVHTEERYSATLDRHFAHQVLTIGYSYDGPTEIGGLVVHPDVRRSEGRAGMLISYVRFLWMAAHRELVQPLVLAELLPPLHRPHLPRSRSALEAEQGVHSRPLSRRPHLRLAALAGGAVGDRQGRPANPRRGAPSAPHRLPLLGPRRPLRWRPALRRPPR
jgi:hypothetical protein